MRRELGLSDRPGVATVVDQTIFDEAIAMPGEIFAALRAEENADVFAAASPKQPELLFRNGVVRKPVVFATNRLIVLVPRSNPAHIRTVYDLRRDGVKVVIGDKTVPIGTYTRQLLDTLGITAEVTKNVVSEETDVKGIVTKVALGEAAGEVATEALGEAIAVAAGEAATPGEAAVFTWPETPA